MLVASQVIIKQKPIDVNLKWKVSNLILSEIKVELSIGEDSLNLSVKVWVFKT